MQKKRGEQVEKEVLREALRLFPKLVESGAYLAAIKSDHGIGEKQEYGLYLSCNDFTRPVRRMARYLIAAFVSCGWLEKMHGRLILNEAGAAWLRRQEAGADPFREQHQERDVRLMDVGGARRPVIVNDAESPLGWLRRRKGKNGAPLINNEQFEAGERLRADFTRGQMTPNITANWAAPASSRRSRRAAPSGPGGITDDALAARQRVNRALEWVGPELAGILLDVCCYLRGLEEAEKGHGWPKRSGKVILQIALMRLARHYGLGDKPSPSDRRTQKLKHWGSDDYKPTLDVWI